jgi:hypothetical protein
MRTTSRVNPSALILAGFELPVFGSSLEARAQSPSTAEEFVHFAAEPVEKRTGRLTICATYENIG